MSVHIVVIIARLLLLGETSPESDQSLFNGSMVSSVADLLGSLTQDASAGACAVALGSFSQGCRHAAALAGVQSAGMAFMRKGRKLRAMSDTLPIHMMNLMCKDVACAAAAESASRACSTGREDLKLPGVQQVHEIASQCVSVRQKIDAYERQEVQSAHDEDLEEQEADADLPVLPPVVVIPALTATHLAATIKRDSSVTSFCMLEGEDHVWPPDVKNIMVPGVLPCWLEEFSIKIDVEQTRARSEEVDVEPDGVHVHPDPRQRGDYGWEKLTSMLQEYGYREGRSIFSAPYDWRHGPSHWAKHSWSVLKVKVEGWVAQSGGKPAIFVADSMGAPYFAAFLLHARGIDAEWKRRHVAGFVCSSPVLAGVRAALGLMLWGAVYPVTGDPHAGYAIDIPGQPEVLRDLLRGFGSISWILPKMGHQEPLVQLPPAWGGHLMAEHLPGIFREQGANGTALLYEIAQRFPTTEHPGVKTLCMVNHGLPTYGQFQYTEEPVAQPSKLLSSLPGAAKGKMQKLLDAESRVEAVIPKAAEALKQQGFAADEVLQEKEVAKEKVSDYFSNMMSVAMTGKQVTGDHQPVPKGPPAGAKYGDERWLASVAALLKHRRPDYVELEDGDGLVLETSLSQCEGWHGQPGLPDVEVRRNAKVRHSGEKSQDDPMKHARDFVLRVSGVTAKVPQKKPICERPSIDSEPIITYKGRKFHGSDDDFDDLVSRIESTSKWTKQICGALSVAFIARWDSLGSWTRIIDFGSGPSRSNIVIANLESSSSLLFAVQNGHDMRNFRAVVAKDAIVLGEEHTFLCTVTESGRMRIYRDGKLMADNPNGHAPIPIARRHLYVAKSNWYENEMFIGKIKDVRIWSRTVDPSVEHDVFHEEEAATGRAKHQAGRSKEKHAGADVHPEDGNKGDSVEAPQRPPLPIMLPVLGGGICFGLAIFMLLITMLCGRKQLRSLLPKRFTRGSFVLSSDAIEDTPFVDVGGFSTCTTEDSPLAPLEGGERR